MRPESALCRNTLRAFAALPSVVGRTSSTWRHGMQLIYIQRRYKSRHDARAAIEADEISRYISQIMVIIICLVERVALDWLALVQLLVLDWLMRMTIA